MLQPFMYEIVPIDKRFEVLDHTSLFKKRGDLSVSCWIKYTPIFFIVSARFATAMVLSIAVAGFVLVPETAMAQAPASFSAPSPVEQLYESLHSAREQVRSHPQDAKARFQLAELLRKAGRTREAAQEYLDVTNLDPSMYVAFHELATCSDDQQLLEEATGRLEKAKDDHPKDLMLRVALSELLEKRQNYLLAARTLIDLQYDNGVPEKYRNRVNARIHYLLGKSKEAQIAEKQAAPSDDELDVVPSPLPDTGLRKGLGASKIKESREMKGMGHVPLLQ